MRPIPVAAGLRRLAGVPRILVHRGYHPVGGDLAGDAPPAIGAVGSLGGFDVLPGDQRQQRQRRGHRLLGLVLIDPGERLQQRVRVVDQG